MSTGRGGEVRAVQSEGVAEAEVPGAEISVLQTGIDIWRERITEARNTLIRPRAIVVAGE
jgi:hypothetical protein